MAWSLAQMTPLNVCPSMPPPVLATGHDAIARSRLDARDAQAVAPVQVCQQEHSQPMNMSHHGLTGSHSSPHSQGSRGPDRHAQSMGTHAAGTLGSWVRSQQLTPLEAEDAEQLCDPRRKRTSDQPSKLGGLPPGKSQNYGQDQRSAISASYSVLTVCRVR